MRTPPDSTANGTGGPLLTVEAAADYLSIGRTNMYALIKAGHVTTVQIGHLRRVPTESLAAYTTRLAAEQTAAGKDTHGYAA